MHTSRRVVGLAFAVVALVALARPGLVQAECPYYPIPPATDAARSAREVIVGTVVENVDGQLYDFRLRIDHVLRGPAQVGVVRRFTFLFPGWPVVKSGGKLVPPCEPIPGWEGNVIAFSLNALASDGKTRYNAASWISGRLPIYRDVPRTTLARIREIAALPPTDTALFTSGAATTAGSLSGALVAVAASSFAVATILLGRRSSRRLLGRG
jgi:hypothetical protein